VSPGDVRSHLPLRPPEAAEPLADVLHDLDRVIAPGLLHWQHPAFFGYFPASASGPSILGELLSAGLGVQGMLWATSPACTELETHVLDWLHDLLGLPERFASSGTGGGVLQDSASSGVLVALVAARERATALAVEAGELDQAVALGGAGEFGMLAAKVAVVLRLHFTSIVADDIAAIRDPFFTQGRKAFFGLAVEGGISPRAAAIIHADGLIHLDAAIEGFCR
jgi:hypothetical protein